jgi:hypothetical protein
MMSYAPTLSYAAAEQLLVSTATDGNLNVTAAFQAAGLGEIVTQGNANIPKRAPSTSVSKPAAHVVVRVARWRDGRFTLTVSGLAEDRLNIELEYKHSRDRRLSTQRATITIRTPRPRLVLLRVMEDHKQLGRTITVDPT